MPRWPRHSCVATGTGAPGDRGAWGGGRPRTQAPADRARRTHRDDRASDGRCQGTRDNRSTMLLVAVPRQVSCFRLLTLSCQYGMLCGSDCNNNTLRDVIGVKRGDRLSVSIFWGMGVDNYTALKQVSLLIDEPSLTQLGSWRLTAVLNVTVATWIGHAAAVLSGTWGAVTRRVHQSGSSRTTVYTQAQRVVQAVASAQAGGISYDALWQENEQLKAENDALWQAWSEAEELSEAKQRDVAGSGGAMGLSLSQIVTLLAIVLPWSAVPSRAMVGRWVQEAAAQAGRLLVVLDLAYQARVRVLCLDEIFLHREPVLMALEPHSMAWMAGQRGPDRSGESWRTVIANWPCLEHVIADGGQGLERGVKLANAARGMQGEAAETIAR